MKKSELESLLWVVMLICSAVCIKFAEDIFTILAALVISVVSVVRFGMALMAPVQEEKPKPPRPELPAEKEWVHKYFAGEFDPKPDYDFEVEPVAEAGAGKVEKFVIRQGLPTHRTQR